MSEQSNELLEKDAFSSGYRERVVVIEKELARVSADVKSLTAQSTAEKDLLDGNRTSLAIHKTASRPGASAHTKNRERLLPDKAVVETKFRNFRADMQAKNDRIHASLDSEVKRANALDSGRVRLLVSQKSLKRHLQLRSDEVKR